MREAGSRGAMLTILFVMPIVLLVAHYRLGRTARAGAITRVANLASLP